MKSTVGVKTVERKPVGPKLAHETRSYEVSESELSLWLTGESRFHVLEIKPTPAGGVEFIVSTRKQAEVARPYRTVNEQRAEHGLPPIDEAPLDPVTEYAEDMGGPAVLDEQTGPVGTADPVPMIAGRNETGKARLKTRRELDLERVRAGQQPIGGPRITDRTADEDDPVPSALPR